jgi:D-aminopeptidase
MYVRLLLVALLLSGWTPANAQQKNLREHGIAIGVLPPGQWNAITDVPGVKVGQKTLASGDNIRTGVTAVLPHAGNVFQDKVPAAVYVGNGFGKLMGTTQVEELGDIETPIVLTNTLGDPFADDPLIHYTYSFP